MIRRHVLNDVRPYVCTFLDCSRAGKTFASRLDFWAHGFWVHIRRESWWADRLPGLTKACVFCEEVLPMANGVDSQNRSEHVARHMEEIAFAVVTKPYEDWDFYSDASSVKHQGTSDERSRYLYIP